MSDDGSDDASYASNNLIATIKDIFLYPLHLSLSYPARRAYLRTSLLLFASTVLAALSVIAYTSFYYVYIPARGHECVVHLQFSTHGVGSQEEAGAVSHPYGVAGIQKGTLASRQKYNVVVKLWMPRTDANLAAGNFMLDLQLLGPAPAPSPTLSDVSSGVEVRHGGEVLARSRRPAILTFRSAMVELGYRLVRLPWYLVGWGYEAERVSVGMLEGFEFEKGWRNEPSAVRVEMQSSGILQVYGVRVIFTARFSGLRYLMHSHRLLSFFLFTTSFWSVSMTFLFLTWSFLTFLLSPTSTSSPPPPLPAQPLDTKTPPDFSLSDTSRTFPTFSQHPPLRYSASDSRVKREVKSEDHDDGRPRLEDIPPRTPGDADDEEDEDVDFIVSYPEPPIPEDSGLGTSLESGFEHRGGMSARSGRRGDGGD